jgi:post-segregation antitoxin (ccd killing protein)
MAKRISVTIPEDLYIRLLGIKKVRKSFNISRACQVGIKEAIKNEEIKIREESLKREKLFTEKVRGLQESLKKMKQEYQVIKKELEEKGIEMEPKMKRLFEGDKKLKPKG